MYYFICSWVGSYTVHRLLGGLDRTLFTVYRTLFTVYWWVGSCTVHRFAEECAGVTRRHTASALAPTASLNPALVLLYYSRA